MIVSNSYGCPESPPAAEGCTPLATNPAYDHKGVLIVASAGDEGAGAAQPCDLSTVICVGGTSVAVSKGGQYSEAVWDGLVKNQCGSGPCATGSGCSTVVEKPSWQHDHGCTWRSETDLSAVADPYTGVEVQCTPCYPSGLSSGHGGTSASSPIIAAMYALSGNANSQTGATLWAHNGKGFNDVTSGSNESKKIHPHTFICPKSYAYICEAGKGYDGPTGWGSPNGLSSL